MDLSISSAMPLGQSLATAVNKSEGTPVSLASSYTSPISYGPVHPANSHAASAFHAQMVMTVGTFTALNQAYSLAITQLFTGGVFSSAQFSAENMSSKAAQLANGLLQRMP